MPFLFDSRQCLSQNILRTRVCHFCIKKQIQINCSSGQTCDCGRWNVVREVGIFHVASVGTLDPSGRGHRHVVVVLSDSRVFRDLQVVLLGDEHRLQGVQGSLLLLVRDKDTALLAVKGAIDAGDCAEL